MPSRFVVRGFIACCAATPLVACTMVAAGNGPQAHALDNGEEYALHPGEQVALADHGRLRYERLVSDSRCAPDVQCIWAGDAEVAFEWTSERGATQSFSLHTGVEPRQQTIGTRRLTLTALARGPAPAATVRLGLPGTP